MDGATDVGNVSTGAKWAGRVVTALPVLLLLMSGVMSILRPPEAVQGTVKFGYAESSMVPLGITLLSCVVIHLIPQTAVLGAILLTGWLGGAVATHVRVYEGVFPIIFPVIVGSMIWLGLVLRSGRVRAVLPVLTK